ncbi:MAG: helix-turn-helix domain-containing protein [Bdellovibrionales bacterium]
MSSSKESLVRKALAQNITKVRKGRVSSGGKSWTQAHLAKLCSVSLGTIQKIEAGNSWPDWKTVVKVSDALNVDVDSLYMQNDKMELETALKIVNESLNIYLQPAKRVFELDKDFFMDSLKQEVDQASEVLPVEVHEALDGLVKKVIKAVK